MTLVGFCISREEGMFGALNVDDSLRKFSLKENRLIELKMGAMVQAPVYLVLDCDGSMFLT